VVLVTAHDQQKMYANIIHCNILINVSEIHVIVMKYHNKNTIAAINEKRTPQPKVF